MKRAVASNVSCPGRTRTSMCCVRGSGERQRGEERRDGRAIWVQWAQTSHAVLQLTTLLVITLRVQRA